MFKSFYISAEEFERFEMEILEFVFLHHIRPTSFAVLTMTPTKAVHEKAFKMKIKTTYTAALASKMSEFFFYGASKTRKTLYLNAFLFVRPMSMVVSFFIRYIIVDNETV